MTGFFAGLVVGMTLLWLAEFLGWLLWQIAKPAEFRND
jgi:hypothetical protein